MKKLVLPLAMTFFMAPMFSSVNAAEEESRICHEIAVGYAEYQGNEGLEYSNDYMEAYNQCENHM
ncbi:hypothetical protein ACW6QP_11140 [Salegentibacter sp. HM20]